MAKNELVSLALLKISPMHAYAINSILEAMGVEHWAQVSRASIYAALNRLEKRNAIEVRLEKVDNMPERKVFSITDEGDMLLRQEVKDAITITSKAENTLFHLAINLFFGIPVKDGIVWAKERIGSLVNGQKHLQSEIEQMQECGCVSALITMEAAMDHITVELQSTKDFISLLEKNPDYYNDYMEYMKDKIANDTDKECK